MYLQAKKDIQFIYIYIYIYIYILLILFILYGKILKTIKHYRCILFYIFNIKRLLTQTANVQIQIETYAINCFIKKTLI